MRRKFTDDELEQAIAAYQRGEIAARGAEAAYHVPGFTLLRHVRLRGIPVRPSGFPGRRGPDHPAWKGGRYVTDEGYVRVYVPDHPWPRKGGYVYEHVLVIEREIGRRMLPSESVHHIDHNRSNNDRSNLEMTTRGSHARHHRHLDTHRRKRDALGRFA